MTLKGRTNLEILATYLAFLVSCIIVFGFIFFFIHLFWNYFGW